MNELTLIKSENFGAVECDFYRNDDEICMTREQIGAALEYGNPQKAIGNIHSAHRERLNNLSFLESRNGHNIYFYTRKGIMEICRWSQQPNADDFMDWAWNIMDSLMSGNAALVSNKPVSPNELIMMMAQSNIELEKRVDRIESNTKEIAEKFDTAIKVFSAPDKDHWKTDINEKIENLAKDYSLSPVKLRGDLYKELEETANCRIQSRVNRLQNRLKKQGVTYRERQAVTKLDAISKDKQLRAIFEGIVKKYQAFYTGRSVANG
jgi:prophage antirepressor-like protein